MTRLYLLLAFILSTVSVSMAQVRVTGKVVDSEDGNPVPFATVAVKGTNIGALTAPDGAYSISVPNAQSVLVFSSVDYATLEESPGTRTVVNVQLVRSSVSIEEVVVTGFGDVKKETFTGSSVKLNVSDIDMAGMTDVSRMLEGKVAGVSIQNVSSTFGAAPKVRIRGVTSISGENKPLWVVDGVVLEDIVQISNDQLSSGDPTTLLGSSVAGLNPNDIETFDILKDATATALYGARAMNGVIVITTKRGKSGAPSVTYNANFTIRQKPRYENFDILNSADQMAVYSHMENLGMFDQDIVNTSDFGAFGFMHNAINGYNPATGFGLENTIEARAGFLNRYARSNTDWFDLLFTNKLMQEHTLSVTSGTEKSRTYASIGMMNDAGATIADHVTRFTGNLRNDVSLGEKVTLGLQLIGSYRDQRTPGSYARGEDAARGSSSREFDINPFSYAYNTSRTVRPYDEYGNLEFVQKNFAPFNILHELENNFMDINVADIKAQLDLEYKILPGLKFNFLGSARYVTSSQEHTVTETSNIAEAYRAAENSTIRERNPYLWLDPSDTSGEKKVALEQGGFLNTSDIRMTNFNVRNSLSYTKMFYQGDRTHEISVMGGMEVKSLSRVTRTKEQDGYLFYEGGRFAYNPLYAQMALEQRDADPMVRKEYHDRFAALYATANYTFDRRYSVDMTFRYDGSNQLGIKEDPSSRWMPTWNFGAKWNIGNEAFMENSELFDAMSLRASYGLVATMPFSSNSKTLFYNDNTYNPGYSESSIYINAMGNKDLTWEKLYQFNVGFDVTMLRGRLSLNVDYFDRRSFDLIDWVRVSGVNGQSRMLANYADLYANGFDVMLGGTIVDGKDLKYRSNLTFGYSRNTIRNAQNKPRTFDLVKETGGNKNNYPVNGLFSLPFYGLVEGIPTFSEDGRHGWSLESLDTDRLIFEGSVDPPYTGGWNNTVTWKGVSFSAFVSYQWGNKIRLHSSFRNEYSDLDAMTREFRDRWVGHNDDPWLAPQLPDNMIENYDYSGYYPYSNYNYSTARVVRGDFVRLKSLSLGYDIPYRWLERSKVFRSANVRVTGKDLWLIYSDKALNGQDPEFFNTGGVALPALPQVIFSLTLGF